MSQILYGPLPENLAKEYSRKNRGNPHTVIITINGIKNAPESTGQRKKGDT